SSDEIIKRKLLIEGNGGNDEKRIANLLRTFIKWCDLSESPEDSNVTYQKMLSTLSQCEYAMFKSEQVYNMCLKEQENYKKLNDVIADEIEKAGAHIEKSKIELQQALNVRRYKEEYDAMAKVIQQHTDRGQLQKELKSIEEELVALEETRKLQRDKLDNRRKQFYVLIASCHELQRLLKGSDLGLIIFIHYFFGTKL
ncbi:hypothetical protein HELRODRAFT_78299, partial [Helobdella robusta]|uniref:THO complex subunit 7 homolog n=1 Tax=Helobdella robusta TaxID=6412 RepID=T1G3A6_HELRO